MLRVEVLARHAVADGIVGLTLGPTGDLTLPKFRVGAHIDVATPLGVRQYSLCNAPRQDGTYEIAVQAKADGRGGSIAMHAVGRGDMLEISAPRESFWLDEQGCFSVLIAGGIGITPILPMAERLHALGKDFALHYSTRSTRQRAFSDRLSSASIAARSHCYATADEGQGRMDIGKALGAYRAGMHTYVCGPSGLIDAVRAQADRSGWPPANVHWEHFGASVQPQTGDRGFELVLRRCGLSIPVLPAQSAADALIAHGVDVPLSCGQGVCGTCLTTVLDGEVEHRDMFLTETEQAAHDRFLPCCSRAKSDTLVLDL
jgi:vanillate O-demethylase ferredoxin subunit